MTFEAKLSVFVPQASLTRGTSNFEVGGRGGRHLLRSWFGADGCSLFSNNRGGGTCCEVDLGRWPLFFSQNPVWPEHLAGKYH